MPVSSFGIGDRVIVHGLRKAAHLNGRHGCIGATMDPETGRFPVDLDTWPYRVMANASNFKREPVPPIPEEEDEEKTDKDDEGRFHSQRVAGVHRGILVEREGRSLGLLLDSIRFLVGSVLLHDPDTQRGLIDIERLRRRGEIPKVHKLLATAWPHWTDAQPHYTPDNQNVEQLLRHFFHELPRANPGQKMPIEFDIATAALYHRTAVRGWNDRLEGEFWIVGCNEETGGTFLVINTNLHLAYEVFGLQKSLYSRVDEQYGPILIKALLLPWYGRLVCDQAVQVAKEPADENLAVQLENNVELAIQEGRVVEKLRHLEFPGSEKDAQSCTLTESQYLRQLAESPVASQDEAVWCMRRRGYTEQDNPHHLGIIINSVGMVAVGPFSCSALEPSAEDILRALVGYCGNHGTPLPAVLLVDDLNCFKRLHFLLKYFGILVQYYPPPTPEETEAALRSR